MANSAEGRWRKTSGRRLEILNAQTNLLQVIGALGTSTCLTRRLNRRQEQRDQDADDGDDHQQFDEREPAKTPVP